MKKSFLVISWIFYLLSLAALAYGFITQSSILGGILKGVILLIVPWLICIIDCVKSDTKSKGLWIYFIISFGLISIPLWLWKRK